ncbi:hypothetical protein Q9L58_005593 [Maublancomyces gigas]|uniref:Uncharacterized protein n=1 Tax=Discina gigas TaxID=1032678 RepID=A0ABR3GHR2_9PEZI
MINGTINLSQVVSISLACKDSYDERFGKFSYLITFVYTYYAMLSARKYTSNPARSSKTPSSVSFAALHRAQKTPMLHWILDRTISKSRNGSLMRSMPSLCH